MAQRSSRPWPGSWRHLVRSLLSDTQFSAEYPPTLLIHGSGDTDVPYEESVKMEEKLSQFKVKHEFLRVSGGSHCLAADATAVKTAVFQQAMGFVRAQIGWDVVGMPSSPEKGTLMPSGRCGSIIRIAVAQSPRSSAEKMLSSDLQ
jgi:acetyl esterase/lipase